MMSAPLFLAFLVYATLLWSPCHPYYIWNLNRRIQGKLHWMSREMVIDAEMKIKAVQQYRDQYYKSLQYQLGDMVYEMRNSYKKMVIIYQKAERNLTELITTKRHDLHTENIRDFVVLHRLAMEIENKINMIEVWQRRRAGKEAHHIRMQGVAEALRSGTNPEYDELEDVPLREVQVRQRMARRVAGGARPRPAPRGRALPLAPELDLGDQRKNKKWRYVRDDDFPPY